LKRSFSGVLILKKISHTKNAHDNLRNKEATLC
jgi:hypothetical protein